MSTGDLVERRRAERFDVLRQFYDLSEGTPGNALRFRDVIEGYDLKTLESYVVFLTKKGLIDRHTQGFAAITIRGIEVCEDAISHPDQPTEYFPPVTRIENYVHISGDVSGQVQVGTTGSTQTSGIPAEALLGVLAEVRALVNDLVLDAEDAGELDADLSTIDVQLASPRPKGEIIRASLSSVERVLERVATHEAIEAAEKIPAVIEHLARSIT